MNSEWYSLSKNKTTWFYQSYSFIEMIVMLINKSITRIKESKL